MCRVLRYPTKATRRNEAYEKNQDSGIKSAHISWPKEYSCPDGPGSGTHVVSRPFRLRSLRFAISIADYSLTPRLDTAVVAVD